MPTLQQPFTLVKMQENFLRKTKPIQKATIYPGQNPYKRSVQPTCYLVYDALSPASSARAQCCLANSWTCPNNAGFGQNCVCIKIHLYQKGQKWPSWCQLTKAFLELSPGTQPCCLHPLGVPTHLPYPALSAHAEPVSKGHCQK